MQYFPPKLSGNRASNITDRAQISKTIIAVRHFGLGTVKEWTVGSLHWTFCARAFRITHVISIFSASQLRFLANRNPELAGGSQ